MRKFLATVSAIAVAAALAGGVAYTANIALYGSSSACFDSSQTLGCANQLITSINSGVTGNYAFVPGPIGNSGSSNTTANVTLASAIVPTGAIAQVGQGYRAKCAGISTISTTMKVGIAVGRSMQVSLENFAGSAGNDAIGPQPNWDLELQFLAATNPVTGNYVWRGRGLAGQATGTATGQVSVISGNAVTGDNNNLAPIPVTCVMYGGAITGAVSMLSFSVEVLR